MLRPLRSVRARILLPHVVFLCVAAVASVLVVRQILLADMDRRIDGGLVQESNELRKLATGGVDPKTGEPFGGQVKRIFDTFLNGNVVGRNEAVFTYVAGTPYRRTEPLASQFDLFRDSSLGERWASLTGTDRGRLQREVGAVDYMAVPMQSSDGSVKGVFVIAFFRDLEKATIDRAVRAAAGVGLAVLVIGVALAWRVVSGVLRPVRLVTKTARTISDSDLMRRIPVEGDDEVALLAETFNQMLDRLEKAFKMQREFIDDAGHELRTPITIVRGHLELIDEDPEERNKTIALVMDELDRMSRFVDDLLLLARSERPDFLSLGPVEVGPLTEELHTKASTLALREWKVDDVGTGTIVADRQRLTQAMMQLAQNATQHTEDGNRISLGSHIANGEARFWVRDSGQGVPLEEQQRVFNRSTSRRNSRGRREGLGLGLSIVRAIAEAHHGRVELISNPGEGALFTLVIPTDQIHGGIEHPQMAGHEG